MPNFISITQKSTWILPTTIVNTTTTLATLHYYYFSKLPSPISHEIDLIQ